MGDREWQGERGFLIRGDNDTQTASEGCIISVGHLAKQRGRRMPCTWPQASGHAEPAIITGSVSKSRPAAMMKRTLSMHSRRADAVHTTTPSSHLRPFGRV